MNNIAPKETFSTDVSGLPQARPTEVIDLPDGAVFDLCIAPVANLVGANTIRMLAYNGSIPGPTLRVQQGSEISVRVHNETEIETTVHWHGLRLDNRYDGVPHETQTPIPVGGDFIYKVRCPDEGLYWYHPHMREDYGLDMGLYGNIVVVPADPNCWSPVHREVVVTLDDLLIEDGRMAPYNVDGPTFVAMGRFGNVMLTAGQTRFDMNAETGEVVRFLLTNTANTRLFNFAVSGARMKLVGGDSGRYERETWVDEVLLAPSERAIIDVRFETPGDVPLEHRTPERRYVLGTVKVDADAVADRLPADFDDIRTDEELAALHAAIGTHVTRPPDKTLAFESSMPLLYGTPSDDATAWTCPMHPEVVSAEPGTCPKCGMKLIAAEPAVPAAWTCPMHPEVVSAEPGTCPKCGMKLIAAEPAVPAAWTCPMHPEAGQRGAGNVSEVRDEAHRGRAGGAGSHLAVRSYRQPHPRHAGRSGVGGPDVRGQSRLRLVQHDLEARRSRDRQGESRHRVGVPSRGPGEDQAHQRS